VCFMRSRWKQPPTSPPMTGETLIERLTPGTAPCMWRRDNYEHAEVTKGQLIDLILQEDATYHVADDPMRWWWEGDMIWRQRPGMSEPRLFASAVPDL
jgi:hypothetical protein